MLFQPAKVPLKVFSILFKIHWVCCELRLANVPMDAKEIKFE